MVRVDNEKDCKLFIGGLSYETKDDTLKGYFSKWGTIVDSVVMRDSHTRKSRGFGFVTYSEPAMVDEVQKARPHIIDGREVEPKRAVPREDSDKPEAHMTSNKIFVGGVKEDLEEEDLQEHFSQFGTIEKVEIMYEKDHPRKKRGFAFVTFDDYDPADVCVLKKQHYIKDLRCDVKKAISKKDMDELSTKNDRSRNRRASRYDDYDDDRGRSRGGNSRGMDDGYGYGNMGMSNNMGMGNMGMSSMAKMGMDNMGMSNMGMGNMGMGGMGMGNMGMGNMGMGNMGMNNMGMGGMGMGNMGMSNMGMGGGRFSGNGSMSNNGGGNGGNWNRNYDDRGGNMGFDYGNDDFRGPVRGNNNNDNSSKGSTPYGGRKSSGNFVRL